MGNEHSPANNPATSTAGVQSRSCVSGRKTPVPRWLKTALSLFVLIHVSVSWAQYGPSCLLWLCNIALLLALAAAWLENPLLTGMSAVGVLLVQFLWLGGLLGALAGWGVPESLRYLFNPRISLLARGLSLYHGWLPFVLLFLLHWMGYDRRALRCYLPLAAIIYALCFFLIPPVPTPVDRDSLPVTVNFVHGLDYHTRQPWMQPGYWLLTVMLGSSLGLFLPTHLVLRRVFPPPP